VSEGTDEKRTIGQRRDADARVVELVVADDPADWRAAGFTVADDGTLRLGEVGVRLVGAPTGDQQARGIVAWRLAGLDLEGDTLDGLPTELVAAPDESVPATGPGTPDEPHPNGVARLDHVVVLTPDLDRTLAALDAAGLELRRIRDTTSYGSPMRQAFFRLGPTILEVVSGNTGQGLPAADAPATWFGLAVDVDDLDATRALLGEGIGEPKVAVQEGRRIATFRHRQLGISVALAAMDDHADRDADPPGDAQLEPQAEPADRGR
jgi:hypothetical protein